LELDAFVVMPNHMHFILNLTDGGDIGEPLPALGSVVGALKSIVAVEWLKTVKAVRSPDSAKVWQRGYYEHIIRSEGELARIREYIANNPMLWQYDIENPERTTSEEYEKAWSWIERPVSRKA
jgi:REP element-mobilizing transposase RayT